MDWFPIVAGTFKVLVLGTGMFFAIKWHYDKGKQEKEKQKQKQISGPPAPAGHAPDASAKAADIQ